MKLWSVFTVIPELQKKKIWIGWLIGKLVSLRFHSKWSRHDIGSGLKVLNLYLIAFYSHYSYVAYIDCHSFFFSPVHTSTSPGFLSLTPYKSHCHLWTMDTPASSSVNLSINIAWKNISLLFKTKKQPRSKKTIPKLELYFVPFLF